MEPRSNIAVVGGGLAGLTAATVAARSGANVRLFERARDLGGRAGTSERDGVLLNVGPHALYRDGAAARILVSLGVTWSGHRPRVAGYAISGGRRRQLPSGALTLATSGALTARGKVELARTYAALPGVDTASIQDVPLAGWMDENVRETSARKAFAAFMRVSTYGNAPAIASAGAAIGQFQMGRTGVLYLDGGWQTLVESLRIVAQEAGVVIETASRVDSVKRCADSWQVGSRDAAHYFDAVVLAGSPRDAARMVSGHGEEALTRWAAEAVPVRAAVLDVVLSRLPNANGSFALGFDHPTYLSAHSLTARLAPDGLTLITSAWYRDPDGSVDDQTIEQRLEPVLDVVQPSWREHLKFRRYLPDLAVTNDYVRAATHGTSGRPGPSVPDAPGLFVAGDWVGPEGMLADAAVASGQSAGLLAVAQSASVSGKVFAA